MVLKFETNLREVGSLATENGLRVAGFYTDLVELKPKGKAFRRWLYILFYTDLVELKHSLSVSCYAFSWTFYTDLVELKLNLILETFRCNF